VKQLLVGNVHRVEGGKDPPFNKIFTQGALELPLPLPPDKGNLLEI
jgi:hypothetical protein